jgi:cellulose synthase/poly-beta-1,6-N-acetylglucosamine synthase-like glycosyltransferase
MLRHYADPRVGAVSGEKKVMSGEGGMVQAEGESIYWRYESLLKKWDSQYYTVVGAAGELFSLRRSLYTSIPESTILDDFFLSLKVCEQGFVVMYEPEAVAMESASSSIKDEKKRKARISAGAFQAIGQFTRLLIPYPDPRLTFQYVSHRLMRWVVCPFALPVVLLLNFYLVATGTGDRMLYGTLLVGQCLFYLMAVVGWLMSVRQKYRIKIFYIPFYFLFMNYSVWIGLYRYLTHSQSSVWDKAKRMEMGS